MVNPLHEEYVKKFPPAKKAFADEDNSFQAQLYRLKKQTHGSEPHTFDDVMELVYLPEEGQTMFIDNSMVELDGKLWVYHIIGRPEDLERHDPRIRKLGYEFCGYATGTTLFDLQYQGQVPYSPPKDWEAIATWCPANVIPFGDQFISVYTAVGIEGTRIGAAFSKNLLDWEPHPNNPLIAPPSWAQTYGPCKDVHVLRQGDNYLIYYSVKSLDGYSAIALAETKDFQTFKYADQPVFKDSYSIRGTTGIESSCIVERNGVYHLFYCTGPGTWHSISDNPYTWSPDNGKYLVGPFVAAEMFLWNNEWWFSSTKKEELRRLDRIKGISHHGDVEDERRNLAGMFLAHVRWEGNFPTLEKPSDLRKRQNESVQKNQNSFY